MAGEQRQHEHVAAQRGNKSGSSTRPRDHQRRLTMLRRLKGAFIVGWPETAPSGPAPPAPSPSTDRSAWTTGGGARRWEAASGAQDLPQQVGQERPRAERIDQSDQNRRHETRPRIEPMPPITMTTKARIRMFSPIPICTVRIGACISPAEPQRAPRQAPNHQRVEQLDVDAEARRSFRGLEGAGADQHADAGFASHRDRAIARPPARTTMIASR